MRPTCRFTVDRQSTDIVVEPPLMSAEVSTVTISVVYRSTTGRISVNYRPICGPILWYRSTSRPIVGWYLADNDGRHWSTEYQSTYRPTYRARLGRYVQHNEDIWVFILSLVVQRSIDAQSSLNHQNGSDCRIPGRSWTQITCSCGPAVAQ